MTAYRLTDVMAWTCRVALVMGVALFSANQARAADVTDITNEMQKRCNPYDAA